MATISGCHNSTAWLEESPVMSDTALGHGALLAIRSHNPVIIIWYIILSNSKLAPRCPSYTPTQTHQHTCIKKRVHRCHLHKARRRHGNTLKHTATQKRREQRRKAKSHKIHHQRIYYSQTLMFHPSQPSETKSSEWVMLRKTQQTSPAHSIHI